MASSPIQPYASLHVSPDGPGDARPTASKIIEDEDLTGKWADKTILITGGAAGLGLETARALHSTGACIFLTARNMAKAEAGIKDILSTSPSSRPIEIVEMELGSLSSVAAGAKAFLSKTDTLNILINNAGIMAIPSHSTTADGFELQLGTNHLSHFLLTKLLLPTLVSSSTPAFASRVVNLSSMGHHYSANGFSNPEIWQDLNSEVSTYDPWIAYGRSKTANALHASHIESLYGADPDHPVHAWSLHPGGITTGLFKHDENADAIAKANWAIWKSVEQGAATSVWCAAAKALEGRRGMYCEDVGESVPDAEGYQMPTPGFATWAADGEAAEKLWEVSEGLVGEWAD
ncbi:NAD(P)-binding protein [Aulographum hederae CBS 113979]|uniref:NAD(P)-binding protein n=1 Tax=Aulographum hederae CBS 113979 TaxID=1176131 RepID=A0A6G1HBF8_9PEZI|nr:NAD(P)-binding protein [Aulographum hederae CBS 113979]